MPKWQMLEKTYVQDELVGPGERRDTIELPSHFIPAEHWKPLDASAEVLKKKYAHLAPRLGPIESLPLTIEQPSQSRDI